MRFNRMKFCVTQLKIILIITSVFVLSCTGVSAHLDHPIRPAVQAQAFTVPVTIETYGNAWDGYLAFGLWRFPYNSTGFSLTPLSYLVVMTTKGQLLDLRTTEGIIDPADWMATYVPVKYIGNDTIMFEGEPDTSTHFWNLKTNTTTNFPNVYGHHDMIYNPTTGTFLTLWSYLRQLDGKSVLMDEIVELDRNGNPLWTWDTYANGHFGLQNECPCNDTTIVNGQTVIDLTHGNSLQWNFADNTIYFNMRHLSTFCKIDMTTSKTQWCLGEYGNFTLLGSNGKTVSSLWWDAHDVHEISPDVFLMFDNDYNNLTVPCAPTFESTVANSRLLEVTVNEQNRTAWVSWSWEAPRADWSPYWGEADVLPNGDIMGTFGSESHFIPGSSITTPLTNSTGAVVVEVTPSGRLVRTYTFPYAWGIYRVVPIPLKTITDYDNSTHAGDLRINLTTVNDLGGPASIYYRINGGPIQGVGTSGQPLITTEGSNNTLEYWSVDNYGIAETPHNILTGIKLSSNSESMTIIPVGAAGVIVATPPVLIRRRGYNDDRYVT